MKAFLTLHSIEVKLKIKPLESSVGCRTAGVELIFTSYQEKILKKNPKKIKFQKSWTVNSEQAH